MMTVLLRRSIAVHYEGISVWKTTLNHLYGILFAHYGFQFSIYDINTLPEHYTQGKNFVFCPLHL